MGSNACTADRGTSTCASRKSPPHQLALLLGLAGRPSVSSQRSNLADYVSSQEESRLAGPGTPRKKYRRHRTKEVSSWHLKGVRVSPWLLPLALPPVRQPVSGLYTAQTYCAPKPRPVWYASHGWPPVSPTAWALHRMERSWLGESKPTHPIPTTKHELLCTTLRHNKHCIIVYWLSLQIPQYPTSCIQWVSWQAFFKWYELLQYICSVTGQGS